MTEGPVLHETEPQKHSTRQVFDVVFHFPIKCKAVVEKQVPFLSLKFLNKDITIEMSLSS